MSSRRLHQDECLLGRFLMCVIDICSKYAWVIPLKDKKGVTITNPFQKVLKESHIKQNEIWVDDIEMYSTHHEETSAVAKSINRTLKNRIYKYMTSISKNVYIDKLDDIVYKHSNTYSTIKMKPVDVKSNTYVNSSKEINNKNRKFKVANNVRISKYKNVFAKGYTSNLSEEVFVIEKVKSNVPWTCY